MGSHRILTIIHKMLNNMTQLQLTLWLRDGESQRAGVTMFRNCTIFCAAFAMLTAGTFNAKAH